MSEKCTQSQGFGMFGRGACGAEGGGVWGRSANREPGSCSGLGGRAEAPNFSRKQPAACR